MQSRKLSLFIVFFFLGVSLASWVTRSPSIRDAISASIAEMGLVLAGLSVGAMIGILLSGKVIEWRGTKFTMLTGSLLACLSMFTMAMGVLAESQTIVTIGFFLFGAGVGIAEIATNMDAAYVENTTGRHCIHLVHGCFSLGTLIGGLFGLAANYTQLPIAWHFISIFIVGLLLIAYASRNLPSGYGKKLAADADVEFKPTAHKSAWLDKRVLTIGFVVLAMALTEGSAYDWLPIILVDEHNFSAAAGSVFFIVFAVMTTIGRFGCGYFLNRFGRLNVIRFSIILAAIGLAFIALGQGVLMACIAVACWGIGASLGFPLALSAAAEGDGESDMNERVKVVAIIGYIALLAGPPSLGFIGNEYGLRTAMLVVLSFVVLSIFASGAVRTPKTK